MTSLYCDSYKNHEHDQTNDKPVMFSRIWQLYPSFLCLWLMICKVVQANNSWINRLYTVKNSQTNHSCAFRHKKTVLIFVCLLLVSLRITFLQVAFLAVYGVKNTFFLQWPGLPWLTRVLCTCYYQFLPLEKLDSSARTRLARMFILKLTDSHFHC